MADLLADTDIFVDHLRTGAWTWLGEVDVAYSVVTRAELFAGRAADEPRVHELLRAMDEILIDREVAELAGQVRRDTRLALPDALIAASALRYDLDLLTRNRRHFDRVAGLRLFERS